MRRLPLKVNDCENCPAGCGRWHVVTRAAVAAVATRPVVVEADVAASDELEQAAVMTAQVTTRVVKTAFRRCMRSPSSSGAYVLVTRTIPR